MPPAKFARAGQAILLHSLNLGQALWWQKREWHLARFGAIALAPPPAAPLSSIRQKLLPVRQRSQIPKIAHFAATTAAQYALVA